MKVVNLEFARCGATIKPDVETGIGVCEYCGNQVVFDKDSVTEAVMANVLQNSFVKEKLTKEHEAYLSTVLSDLTHLKYGFWVDKKNKTYFYETGSQVHDGLEFYTLLYKGVGYHVTTEYLPYSKEYKKCVMIPRTNRQGEDIYEEIKAVVTEIFCCMYGHSVNLCFPDNPEFKSLRSNM